MCTGPTYIKSRFLHPDVGTDTDTGTGLGTGPGATTDTEPEVARIEARARTTWCV